MINTYTEWIIRVPGGALLLYAFYKLYTRPLTHSYHEAFLFNHLQIVLWVMLALIMALIVQSFNKKAYRWLTVLVAAALLAPYPFAHQYLEARAGTYFFHQRWIPLQEVNRRIMESSLDKAKVYDRLAALDIRDYEIGENYVAYWVDRVPEQRDGLIFLQDGKFPQRLFQYPLRGIDKLDRTSWYLFTSE